MFLFRIRSGSQTGAGLVDFHGIFNQFLWHWNKSILLVFIDFYDFDNAEI
jgi:hypothetical protein